jgi:hypothetical protein
LHDLVGRLQLEIARAPGLLLDAIVIQLMQKPGVTEQQMRARHANQE